MLKRLAKQCKGCLSFCQVSFTMFFKCRNMYKGGFVGLRVYDSPRYTVDVDALLVNANVESLLDRAREKAESDLEDGVWLRFEDQVDLATQGERRHTADLQGGDRGDLEESSKNSDRPLRRRDR